jgi:hypothetical protein
MMLPVEVQQPTKPESARIVGTAPEDLTAEEVAKLVSVPLETFLGGKIISRKGERRWSLVADVKFRKRGPDSITVSLPHLKPARKREAAAALEARLSKLEENVNAILATYPIPSKS